jgi:hypothetical protein
MAVGVQKPQYDLYSFRIRLARLLQIRESLLLRALDCLVKKPAKALVALR